MDHPTGDTPTEGSSSAAAPRPSPPRRTTRRRLLKAGLIGVPAVLAVAAAGTGIVYAVHDVNTVDDVDFDQPLAIPPLAPTRAENGRTVYDLQATTGTRQLRSGRPTDTWGFDRGFLGPTLRLRRGETVQINVRNGLRDVTTVHWHGALLPAVMDGGPHQLVQPGQTWQPSWKVDQPAATLWYHPHPHAETARQTYRGMVGMIVVDDDDAAATGLPAQYGVDDIPVIVQDINLDGDNQLDEGSSQLGDVGVLGDTVLVNGTPGPYLDVTTQRVRLRLLNAAVARVYNFGFADDRDFALVGTDGGLLPAPHTTGRVQLSPGERAEIVVTMKPGERVVLRSFAPALGLDLLNERFTGGDDELDILQLRAAPQLRPAPEPAATLAPAPALTVTAGRVDRRFEMSGNQINGLTMDMNRIDFGAVRGSTEVWDVISPFPRPHNFHVHGAHFQVLSVNGSPPPPELRGWKDTVYNPPEVTLRLAVRFVDHPDRNTPFMFHCHLLLHEDRGMMGQYVLLEPGESVGTPAHAGHSVAPR